MMDIHDAGSVLRLRDNAWSTKLRFLAMGAIFLALAVAAARNAHPTRVMVCSHTTGCELREETKVLAHYGDIVDARIVKTGKKYVLELVTTTVTLREDDEHERAMADSRLASVLAYARRESDRLNLIYPSTWPPHLVGIAFLCLLGVPLLIVGLRRKADVDLTFDGDSRQVLVRTSGAPGRATWAFADVSLEVQRGMENKEGRAPYRLTFSHVNGTKLSFGDVPGSVAQSIEERVTGMLKR